MKMVSNLGHYLMELVLPMFTSNIEVIAHNYTQS